MWFLYLATLILGAVALLVADAVAADAADLVVAFSRVVSSTKDVHRAHDGVSRPILD